MPQAVCGGAGQVHGEGDVGHGDDNCYQVLGEPEQCAVAQADQCDADEHRQCERFRHQ